MSEAEQQDSVPVAEEDKEVLGGTSEPGGLQKATDATANGLQNATDATANAIGKAGHAVVAPLKPVGDYVQAARDKRMEPEKKKGPFMNGMETTLNMVYPDKPKPKK